ncbi:uncharacterized protein APUU_40798S [Aspergillus puulaauensis]|uniref:Uncharacterized protein n=1 Tax=Aspergillus puulaauensis TaxID=1220207 RepID=A0A7R8ALV3_9EURO|nr:uncharacterized protein APUU_40798S [Aspergillus puulaauensis]BCS24354.1 hypothetical protein APUU_40798S [Aspergillus puulaauensis]
MQHDIYSLGVCLLKIGFCVGDSWLATSLARSSVSSFWVSLVSGEGHASTLLAGFDCDDPSAFAGDSSLKDHSMALAKEQLPIRMGKMDTQVVVNWLSCMDEMSEEFSNKSEFEDADDILIGVKYVEKVIAVVHTVKV